MKRFTVMVIFLSMVSFGLIGCNTFVSKSIAVSTESSEQLTKQISEQLNYALKKKENKAEKLQIDVRDFKALEDIKEYTFTPYKEGEKTIIKGEIDLEGNGQDETIEFNYFLGEKSRVYTKLMINEKEVPELEKDTENIYFEEAYVVDMDTSDTYKEVVFKGMGAGGNSVYAFIRYREGKPYYLGSIDITTVDSNQPNISTNQTGKLICNSDILDFGKKPIVGAKRSIQDKGLITEDIYEEQERDIKLERDVLVNFLPDKKGEGETIITLEKGEHIKIIDFELEKDGEGFWIVEINGQRGKLYLQIAS